MIRNFKRLIDSSGTFWRPARLLKTLPILILMAVAAFTANGLPTISVAAQNNFAAPTIVETFDGKADPLIDIIHAGQTVLWQIVISNPNPVPDTLTGVNVVIVLPPSVKYIAPITITGNCNGGVIISSNTAGANGSANFSLTGGTIPGNSSCTISAPVTTLIPGTYSHTTGAVNAGNAVNSQNIGAANLTVLSILTAPTITKSFTPPVVALPPGGSSVLTIIIPNTNIGILTDLTSVSLTDTLPAGLTVTTPAATTNGNCIGGGSLVASGSSITLTNGTIPSGLTCKIFVNVTASAVKRYTNTLGPGALKFNGGQNSNTFPANLDYEGPLVETKSFLTNPFPAGGTSKLQIVITNPSTNPSAQTNIDFTDNFPAGMIVDNLSNLTAVPANCNGSNGAVSATSGAATVAINSVNNATLNPGQSCTITVSVTSPSVPAGGSYTNTPVTLTGTDNGTVIPGTINPASVVVNGTSTVPLVASKAFAAAVDVGGTTVMTIKLQNPNGISARAVNFMDSLPSGIIFNNPSGISSTNCGVNATTAGTTLTLANGTILAGSTCIITVNVTATDVTAAAPTTLLGSPLTNTTTPITTANLGTTPGPTAKLVVNPTPLLPPTITKTFMASPILPNTPVTLKFVITNPAAFAQYSVTFTDTLPSPLIVAPNPNIGVSGTGCFSTARVTAIAGTNKITTNNNVILPAGPGATCTVTVDVISPTVGLYSNPTFTIKSGPFPGGSSVVVVNNPISIGPGATPLTVKKAFLPATIAPGGISTITFTIHNPDAFPQLGATFTDNLPTVAGSKLVVANSAPIVATGGTGCVFDTITATPDTQVIKLTGPATVIPANSDCTISVKVTAPGQGTYGNPVFKINSVTVPTTTSSTLQNLLVSGPPSVLPATIAKAFGASSVPLNGTTTLTFTITNLNDGLVHAAQSTQNLPLTNYTFIDGFPGGIKLADATIVANTCGGNFNPVLAAGATSVTYITSNLNPGVCTVTVNVQGLTPGKSSNQIGTNKSDNGGDGPLPGAVPLNIVTPPTISKAFGAASISAGGTTTLTLTINNPAANTVPLTGVSVTDVLPVGPGQMTATVVTTPNAANCGAGAVWAKTKTTVTDDTLTFSNGTIPVGGTCTLTATVLAPATGQYDNTTGNVSATNSGPGGNSGKVTLKTNASLASITIKKDFVDPNNLAVSLTTLPTTQVSRMHIKLTNPAAATQNGVAFSDPFPPGLTFAPTPNEAGNCGGGTPIVDTATNTFSLTGGVLGPKNSGTDTCDLYVDVTSALPQTFSNSTSASSPLGGTGGTTSATITFIGPATVSKTITQSTIVRNQTATLTVKLLNPNTTTSLTGVSLTDANMPGMSIVYTKASDATIDSANCGGMTFSPTPTSGDTQFTTINGSIPASQTCTITVLVTSSTVGTWTNTISPGDVKSTNGGPNTTTKIATLRVLNSGYDIGNRIWVDNGAGAGHFNNGFLDTDESGVPAGVSLTLTGTDTQGSVTRTTTTDANGYYRFDNLETGTYTVTIDAANFKTGGLLQNYISSTPVTTGVDKFNNGNSSTPAIAGISSSSFAVPTVPNMPNATDQTGIYTGASNSTYGPNGAASDNLTIDFGLIKPLYDLGNRVWYDTGAGTKGNLNNGVLDNGEIGVPAGVTLTLNGTDSAGNTISKATSTDANGYYRFDNLPIGTYTVTLDAKNFQVGGLLQNAISSTPVTTGVDKNNNGHDNSPAVNGVTSASVTFDGVKPSPSATDVPNTGGNSGYGPNGPTNDNLTVDFGVIPKFDLGNRLWIDTNQNGVLDNGETGVPAGVTLTLTGTDSFGTAIAPQTTTTDGSGYYRFDNLDAGSYTVTVDKTNFQPGGLLQYYLTSPLVNGATVPGTDNDNNGTNSTTLATNGVSSNPVLLGPGLQSALVTKDVSGTYVAGNNSTYGPNGQTDDNLTVDFGFYLNNTVGYDIGNRLWFDTNNDRILDNGEVGVPKGVTLTLYSTSAPTTPFRTTTTDANGYYRFDNVPAGTYIVTIDAANFLAGKPLNDYISSTGATSGTDSHDNGLDGSITTSVGISSAPVAVGPGLQSALVTTDVSGPYIAGDNTTYGPGGKVNDNLTVDFGLYKPTLYDLGNRVWIDTNKDGVLNNGEVGVPAGVTLELLDSGGTVVATTTTDLNGYYRFDNLAAGTYTVTVDHSNFQPGGLLQSYLSSPLGGNIGTDNNNNAHDATPATNGLTSGPVTLGPALQPAFSDTNASSPNGNIGPNGPGNDNLTVDFGVYVDSTQAYSIGNRVWLDDGSGTGGVANDGIQNGTEHGLSGAPMKLFAADASGNPIGTALQSISTDASGYYRFDGVATGRYVVVLDLAAYNSSGANKYNLTAASFTNYQIDLQNKGIQALLGAGTVLPGGVVSPLIIITNPATPAGTPPSTNPVNGETDIGTGLGAHGPAYTAAPPATDDKDVLTADFGLVAVSTVPPNSFSIGNRVWLDNGGGAAANTNNGKQDAGEAGIPNVKVLLYKNNPAASGTPLGSPLQTTTTDGNGYYRFDGLAAGQYIVVVDSSPTVSANLVGLLPSTLVSTDYSSAGDQINKGTALVTLPAGVAVSGVSSGVVDTANATSTLNEPDVFGTGLGAHGPLGDNSDILTADFGFYPDAKQAYSIGNRVWYDDGSGVGGVKNDGIQQSGELGVASVKLDLFYADNTGKIIGNAPIQTTTSNTSGYYRFDGVTPGTYVVVVDQGASTNLYGYTPSSVVSTDYSATGDQHNKGTLPPLTQSSPVPGGISSGVITITPGSLPLKESDVLGDAGVPSGHGPNSDDHDLLTADFGFIQAPATYSIGNRVWSDLNGDGKQQDNEPGIGGVTVVLYNADKTGTPTTKVGSVVTDNLGFYRFDGLPKGDYIVIVDVANSPALAGTKLTTTLVTTPNNNTADGLNNGTATTTTVIPNGVPSGVISLGARPSEPLGEVQSPTDVPGSVFTLSTAPQSSDDHGNLTIDFGFISPPPSPSSNPSPSGTANPSAFDPAIVKLVDPSLALPGEAVKFTIILSNPGTVIATNVTISDPVPARLIITGASTPLGTYTISGNTVTFNIGTLAANQVINVYIFAKIDPNVVPPIDLTNTATATLNGITISATTLNASATLHVTGGTLPSTGEHANQANSSSLFMDMLLGLGAIVTALAMRQRRQTIR